MGDWDFGDDDWDQMFSEREDLQVLMGDPPLLSHSPSVVLSNSPPDSFSSWIGDLENLLMRDDDDEAVFKYNQESCEDFLESTILDHPADTDAGALNDSTLLDDKSPDVPADDSPKQEKIVVDIDNGHSQNNGDDEALSKKRIRY